MTTPREPDGPYERDPYGRGAPGGEESPTWGRPPAGGWGADPGRYGTGYDDPDSGPDLGPDDRYGPAAWDTPVRDVEPRYREPGGRAGDRQGERRGRTDHRAGGYTPSWAPGPSTAGRRAVRARRRALVAVLGLVAALVVAVLVLGFVTPGWFVTRVLDATAVQGGVAKILTDDYATDGVADVRCPERVQVVAGATFTCDATIDADPVKIPVRVTDAKGGYEVGRPT